MKSSVSFNPVFNPAAKTLDFSAYSGFDIGKLYAVINVTRNQVIYAVGQSIYGFSSFSSGILTLVYNTASQNAADELFVLYDTSDSAFPSQNITAQDTSSTTTTGANSQNIVTGTPTVGSVASFTLSSQTTVRVLTSGTWSGTLVSELSSDGGSTWLMVGIHQSGTVFNASSFTANFAGTLNISGATNYRVRATAWSSGTAAIKIESSANQSSVYIANAIKLVDATTNNILGITASNAAKVDGSGVTQPVSLASIPLPTGAATAANQTNNSQTTQIVDPGGSNKLAVGTSGNILVSGASAVGIAPSLNPVSISGVDGGGLKRHILTDAAGTVQTFDTALFTSPIAANTNAPQVMSQPSSLTMAALNASVQYQVEPGMSYMLSITNPAASTTQFSGTVSFSYSTNGSSYTPLVASPVGTPTAQPASSTTTVGLWNCSIPNANTSTMYLRAQMTSYTSGTAVAFVVPWGQPNVGVILPWTYSVTSGNTIMGPLDASGINEIAVQISAITTTVLTAQGTNDPSLTTWATIPVQDANAQNGGALTLTAATNYKFTPNGFKWIRLQVTTTGTVLTIQGIHAKFGQNINLVGYGNGIAISNTPAVTLSSGTVTSVTSSQAAIPGIIQDVASAAITTTTTTGTVTPTFGSSFVVAIPVTAVSGTTPTMDVTIQVSDDGGTNWYNVYDFPRITATGIYRSRVLPFNGNRIRYVQTIAGTSPSFTRSIQRLQKSTSEDPYSQMIDRTISLTTLNSTTASIQAFAKNLTLTINIGAATTAPTLQLQCSDDAGATYYNVGTTLLAVASSTVSTTVTNISAQLVRAIVTSAGSAVTAGYVLIRSF